MRRGRGWSAGVLVALACGGCGTEPAPESYEQQSAQALVGALAEARAAGADASQLEVLSGSGVTFDQYQGAIERALGCMSDAGLEVVSNEVVRRGGQDQVQYAVGAGSLPEDQATSVQQECYSGYAQFVDMFWQVGTPDVLEYEDRRANALHEPLAVCLAGYGVDAPEDASFRELLLLSLEHAASAPDQDCSTDIGCATWEG